MLSLDCGVVNILYRVLDLSMGAVHSCWESHMRLLTLRISEWDSGESKLEDSACAWREATYIQVVEPEPSLRLFYALFGSTKRLTLTITSTIKTKDHT
jgi:hypothetical protein